MKASRIGEHIDNRIVTELSNGNDLNYVMDNIKEKIKSFQSRKDFIKVKRKYLINNWDSIPMKKKYTTYYVLFSEKRLKDIEWVLKNRKKFYGYNEQTLYNLILFRDKLLNKTTKTIVSEYKKKRD